MGNISLNEALGRRESELLSSMVGMSIEIENIENESRKDKDGKDFSVVYITTTDGKTYRTSNKAILTKTEQIQKNLPKGQTLKVKVVEKKVKKGVGKYIDFAEAD